MGNGFEVLSHLGSQTDATPAPSEGSVSFDAKHLPEQVDVVEREVIMRNVICSLPIPKTNPHQAADGTRYEHFGIPVTGGYINFHLFDRAKCVRKGKRLWVECVVWVKRLSDGRSYLNVDLYPTKQVVTHERKIWQDRHSVPANLPPKTLQLECHGQVKGVLGFIPR
jgi:hypothetical protein